VGIDVTDQLMIIFSAFIRHRRKSESTMRQYSRFQETLRFSEEGNIVRYSYRVWGTHEISQAD
jgi:hypothetical protein